MKMDPFPGKLSKSAFHGTPYVLTAEQEAWLREYFPNQDTRILAKMMGCSRSTLNCIAKRLGVDKDRDAYVRRLSENQKKMVESERRRDRWGLPRRTKLHLPRKAYTKKEIARRWKAKRKWGYIPGDKVEERYVIFYDENTRRNKKFESYCEKAGFKIVERFNQDNHGKRGKEGPCVGDHTGTGAEQE